MTFFSIIIPTYNRASLILKTLDSVFAQTYSEFEIIVVDNCSTDNTEEVLAELIQNNKIKFIKHAQNFERSVSRNTGLANAKGDFVTFLDSDDLYYPTLLEEANQYLTKNPTKEFFHTYYEVRDAEGKLISRPDYPSSANHVKTLCNRNFLACIGVFIHKNIYTNITFDTNPILVGTEDYDFWLRVLPLAKGDLGVIPKHLTIMIEHDARTMNNINFFSTEKRIEYLINKFKTHPATANFYKDYLTYFEASQYLFLNAIAIHCGLRKQTIQYIYKAYSLCPALLMENRAWYRIANSVHRVVNARR